MKPTRTVRLATVLAIGVTLMGAPPASADHSWIYPAGEGCSFGVLMEAVHPPEPAGEPGVDRKPIAMGDATLTNLDTGATYLQRVRYLGSETYAPETNTWLVEYRGRRIINFYPGDQGPNGLVEEPGLLLAFTGSIQTWVDPDTFYFTEFSFEGTYVDLCAELSEDQS
ncbi:MAG TPA: hypothetical protein VLI04_22100 [Nocardioidaceae bacterium]|nr:hypothetical protein [Nocardioidaceae bacterium]